VPSPRRVLSCEQARSLISDRGFSRGPDGPPPDRQVGIELEWLAVDLDHPTRPASTDAVHAAVESVGTLPGASHVTFEPGGQIELSSPPALLPEVCDAVATDVRILGRALATAGVGLIALGLEPGPRRERTVQSPRYDAMEVYFDALGAEGRTMMRSTASVQVNLGFGSEATVERAWCLAHDLGPMLAATFANSPFAGDGPTGYRSTRLATWMAIDRCRTAPANSGNGIDCRSAWIEYALAAHVMLLRFDDGDAEPALPALTFEEWIENGHERGWPTVEDLEYHLTTLFPPVRPRGWLELRTIDSLPTPWWRVATAVAALLVHDDDLSALAADAVAPVRGAWLEAARDGLRHPGLATAARTCFDAALAAMPGEGVDATTLASTTEYVDRFVHRGSSPADELLDQWARTGVMLPAPDNLAPTTPAEVA
jgi:glutamate--cysteine ligase